MFLFCGTSVVFLLTFLKRIKFYSNITGRNEFTIENKATNVIQISWLKLKKPAGIRLESLKTNIHLHTAVVTLHLCTHMLQQDGMVYFQQEMMMES